MFARIDSATDWPTKIDLDGSYPFRASHASPHVHRRNRLAVADRLAVTSAVLDLPYQAKSKRGAGRQPMFDPPPLHHTIPE